MCKFLATADGPCTAVDAVNPNHGAEGGDGVCYLQTLGYTVYCFTNTS